MNNLTALLAAVEWDVVYQTIGKLLTLLALLLAGSSTLLCLFFTAFTWAFIRVEPDKSLIGIIGAVCAAMVV
ncbi:hypothetical protein J9253_16195 [Thiothrix litoralis]|uniref:Uncharacterized protein n=1 Tax=Thiothrix litoralis TaxID=2891210 RepID=A0ABX7WPG5_9GAMM|nr:hypothetical protein [Thiothrix litoralis]QTR45529.1 hypothetical protein J9253_16195 [Thiothrix litoralis]